MNAEYSAIAVIICCLALPAHAQTLLKTLYERALQYDPEYTSQYYRSENTRLDAGLALSALKPSLTGSYVYSENNATNTGPQRSVNSDGRYRNGQTRVVLNQALYDPVAYDRMKSSEAQAEAMDYQLARSRQALILKLTGLYWDVMLSALEQQQHQALLAMKEQELENTRNGFRLGQISEEQLNTIRADVLSQRYQRELAGQRYQDARQALYESTLVDWDADPLTELNKLQCHRELPYIPDEKQAIETALRHNLQLLTLNEELNSAEYMLESAESAQLPRLSMEVEYSTRQEQGGSFDGSDSERTTASLSLNWPLYSGGKYSREKRKALNGVIQQQTKLDLAHRKLIRQIRKTHRQLQQQNDLISLLNEETGLRESRIRSVRNKLAQGITTRAELREAEAELAGFQVRRYRACSERMLSHFTLLSQTGSLNADIHLHGNGN